MSLGYNYDKVQYKHKNKYKYGCTNTSCSTHAEMSAILSLKGKKANALLVIRVGNDGTLRDSKPCQYCYEFIHRIGIRKIYFSTNNQDIQFMRINEINREDLTISGSNVKLKQSIEHVKKTHLIPKNSRPIFDPTNIKVKPTKDTLECSGIVL